MINLKNKKYETKKRKNYQQFNTLPLAFFSLKGLSSSNQTSSSSSSLSSSTTLASSARTAISIAKVVNPLGTVTTITESPRESILAANEFTEEYSSGAYIHENTDESMFRPYVAVISGTIDGEMEVVHEKPEPIGRELIVPVIDGSKLIHQQQAKSRAYEMERQQAENAAKFEQMRLSNRKDEEFEKIESEPLKSDDKNSDEKERGKENKKNRKNLDSDSSDQYDKKCSNEKSSSEETEVTGNVKLKKKAAKNAAKSNDSSSELDEKKTKSEQSIKAEITAPALFASVSDVSSDMKSDSEKTDAPSIVSLTLKSGKSRKKSLIDSSTSKESSVERELTPPPSLIEEGTKSKKKKQKNKTGKQSTSTLTSVSASASATDNASSSESNKGDTNTDLEVDVSRTVDDNIENNVKTDHFSLLEHIGDVDKAQCAEIQESLSKNSIVQPITNESTAQDDEPFAKTPSSSKNGRKKKSSKESIDNEPIIAVQAEIAANVDEINESTYQEPCESIIDLDSLSFKSTIDDQTALMQPEYIEQQTDDESLKESRNTDEEKSSDIEIGRSGSVDYTNFQLVIDEPEPYVRISDQNSSDETEDSSHSKSEKRGDKVIDDDDEELQPLICSPSDDPAVDLSKCDDALPNDDTNQNDSQTTTTETSSSQKTSEQTQQPQSQKQTNNNNNKKKFRKKRR